MTGLSVLVQPVESKIAKTSNKHVGVISLIFRCFTNRSTVWFRPQAQMLQLRTQVVLGKPGRC